MSEIRIGVIGSVDSGKSTITGVLTNNILDDGRGKARSTILKHPHEKETGRTSSISQHFMKLESLDTSDKSGSDEVYKENNKIINFVDLAGHEKYLKTTINGIKRCLIDYSCVVVGANMGVLHMTREHIALTIALNIPTFVILTKIDLAPNNVKENTINNIHKIFKKYSKKRETIVINDQTNFETVKKEYTNQKYHNIVPIFPVSSVSGSGLDILKDYINILGGYADYKNKLNDDVSFIIDCKYMIKGIGLVISGVMSSGTVRKGDTFYLGPINNTYIKVLIRSIHNNFKEHVDVLYAGQGGCFNIKSASIKDIIKRETIRKGMRIVSNPKTFSQFEADVKILQHPTMIKINYEPTIHCGGICQSAKIIKMKGEFLKAGEQTRVTFKFCYHSEFIEVGDIIVFREGHTKGIGKIRKVIE